jgi:GT2 family glycosyltransferase
MNDPLVINIILNTNRREDTLACLESISKSTYPKQKTLVLDNASVDGSVEAIRLTYPEVQVLNLTKNLGYAGNNNVGIQEAMKQGAEWVFILNEDTILAPDCLDQLINTAETDPRTGIVGPMVYHHDEPNVIQSAGVYINNNWRAFHIGQNQIDCGKFPIPRNVDAISGCAILIRRQVIEDVGFLDERFYYYWEETEWCLRARKADWNITHVPAAKLWHKGVQRDYHPSPSVTYYDTRNWLLMLSKHNAPVTTWLYAWYRTLLILTTWTIRPKWRDMQDHRDAMWQGIRDFISGQWGTKPENI